MYKTNNFKEGSAQHQQSLYSIYTSVIDKLINTFLAVYYYNTSSTCIRMVIELSFNRLSQ